MKTKKSGNKPVVIDAIQFTGKNSKEIYEHTLLEQFGVIKLQSALGVPKKYLGKDSEK